MRTRHLILAALALTTAATLAGTEKSRGGLRTNYSKIVIDNLPIGHAISMTQLANLPLVVGNNFDTPISVSITPKIPGAPRQGYEAIPDAGWLEPEATTVTIPPGEERKIDVVLNLPDDHYLFGRRFQVDLAIVSARNAEQGGVAFAYELTGSLMFSIAPVANDEALRLATTQPLNAAYNLSPPRVDIYNVTPGDKINVVDELGEPVTLTNDSEQPQQFVLKSVDPATTPFTPDPGSRFPGTVSDVAIAVAKLDLAPRESRPLMMAVNVPPTADLKSGPLLYLVSVKTGDAQTVEQFVKVYLWAGERPPKQELGKL